MIGFSKLLCGRATLSEAMRQEQSGHMKPDMLQFSGNDRPLVVWNVTCRCNLNCDHCYIDAGDRRYKDELTTEQGRELIDDLAEMKVPVLLFSGGEPLMREDTLELGRYAAERGLRPVLSTNGTLIDRKTAERIKEAGFQYAGVSIDGTEATHDRFRHRQGAFRAALEGIRNCSEVGVKAGIRFTLNATNYDDLPAVLDLVEELKVPRFCMYHLVYSGRGSNMKSQDVTPEQRRKVVSLLIERTLAWDRRGIQTEVLSTDQHADGAYLHAYITQHIPERAKEVRELLQMHGGCSAGCKMANVDPLGNVHACQFWGHVSLGNVKEQRFSRIWRDRGNRMLEQLRCKQELVKGKCAECVHKDVCGGCRIRAESVYGDMWAEDPACYLTAAERAGVFLEGL
jgi:radical SAM protein with 4Fe4S-binding SPASM domain